MKKILAVFVMIAMLLTMVCGCQQKDKTSHDIKLIEVTHSVFYAPQYVAIEKGFFKDNNVNIELINGGGADKCMAALLSGEADIAFMGPDGNVNIGIKYY